MGCQSKQYEKEFLLLIEQLPCLRLIFSHAFHLHHWLCQVVIAAVQHVIVKCHFLYTVATEEWNIA